MAFARFSCAAALLCLLAPVLPAQDSSTPQFAPVHGIVTNAVTGEPLPRALVTVNGRALGALTDDEGRFEISSVPVGMQTLDVEKPGFNSRATLVSYTMPVTHTVQVTAETPDLHFSLTPASAIIGRVTLGTGDPGVSIGLTLLRQTISDGHAAWNQVATRLSAPDGSFRFAGLDEGTYLLRTQPTFQNEGVPPSCDAAQTDAQGFPIVFYGGSPDAAGAARIGLAAGQTAEANLTLLPAVFHTMRAAPARLPGSGWTFDTELLDAGGAPLDYPLAEDPQTHAACGFLPDGSYLLTVTASRNDAVGPGHPFPQQPGSLRQASGMAAFTLEGHAEMHLRIPLSSESATPIRIRYEPGPPKPPPANPNDNDPGDEMPGTQILMLAAAPLAMPGMHGDYTADSVDTDTQRLPMVPPGSYWIEGITARPDVCIGAVTAGGQNMGAMPWVAGTGGTGVPMDVVLRTDCAKLTVTMRYAGLNPQPGEPLTAYLYLVPEFPTIASAQEGMVVQANDPQGTELSGLTPGKYRIVVSASPHPIEYRNPAVVENLTGQEVTLDPNGSATVVVEAPQP
ncbi:MAG TPA: carboxypeptidase regulatory-like domain-containing protein [Terracidiphilus sp.]|nr:carboxypeptidase regulatory-like domain-containing protein [Terracidiphilus sp.]